MISSPDRPSSLSLEVEYDHDVDLPDELLARFSAIRPALRHEALLKLFFECNARAARHKKAFHQLGTTSVLLAALPLLMGALRLTVGESLFERVSLASIIADCCGLAAVILIAWNRLGAHRHKWLTAMFLRERARQWHFQVFIDGNLVSLLAHDSATFLAERDKRWQLFERQSKSPPAMVNAFLVSGGRDTDLFHRTTPYTSPQIAVQVMELMEILRIDHQLGYGAQKIDSDGAGTTLALGEENSAVEWLASTSLIGAVIVAALASFASLWSLSHPELTGPSNGAFERLLGGLALLLAVLSAVSRAYKAGKTLPDERDSYQDYCDRVREIGALFRATPLERKVEQLESLEREAAGELRRFLNIKRRATFIF